MAGDGHIDERAPRRIGRWRLFVDIILVLALIAVGAWSSWRVLRELGDTTDMRFSVIMQMLRPTVMFAAGKGMRDINPTEVPGLEDFYMQRATEFDVAEIPGDYDGVGIAEDSYVQMHYNLMVALGTAWRLLGVSRWAVNVLAAVFFALLVPVIYGLFRLTVGPLLAAVFSCWLAFSPALLTLVPSVRDFSKAPFLLGGVLLLAWLTLRDRRARWLPLWAVVAGVVVGTGFGFRQDVGLLVPLGLAAFGVLVPVPGERPWRMRAVAVLAFLCAFGVSGIMPIRGTLHDSGSASVQAFVQGVSQDVEGRMDFGHASYTQHYDYSDIFDWTIVNSYARRTGDNTAMSSQFSRGHGEAGQRLVRQYWLRFPGDMMTRAISALWLMPKTPGMVEQPDFILHIQPDVHATNAIAETLPLHAWFTAFAGRYGWVLILAALALVFAWRWRLAVFMGLAIGFLGAYPSLLYEFRHFFHLAVFPYWALATVLGLGAWHVREMVRTPRYAVQFGMRLVSFTLLVVAAVMALITVQAGARAVQDVRMSHLYDRYAAADLEPVAHTVEVREHSIVVAPAAPLPNLERAESLPPYETVGEYLVLAFDGVTDPLCVGVEYDEPAMLTRLSRVMAAPLGGIADDESARFFVPVYRIVWPCSDMSQANSAGGCVLNDFVGFHLKEEAFAHFTGLYRVRGGEAFGVWPYVVIPSRKDHFMRHKLGPLDSGVKRDFRQPCVLSVP